MSCGLCLQHHKHSQHIQDISSHCTFIIEHSQLIFKHYCSVYTDERICGFNEIFILDNITYKYPLKIPWYFHSFNGTLKGWWNVLLNIFHLVFIKMEWYCFKWKSLIIYYIHIICDVMTYMSALKRSKIKRKILSLFVCIHKVDPVIFL